MIPVFTNWKVVVFLILGIVSATMISNYLGEIGIYDISPIFQFILGVGIAGVLAVWK